MTKYLRKSAMVLLSLLFAFSISFGMFNFSLNNSTVAFANSLYEEDDDVAIDTEYVLESRFMPSEKSSIGFSGKRFREGSSMSAGHLFSSTIDGAKVTLGNNFGEVTGYGKNNENANKFSLVGMTVPNSKVDASDVFITWSFKTLNFIITDNADSENVITVTFSGTTYAGSGISGSGPIDITANYNGTSLKTSGDKSVISNLYRASFRNRFFGYEGYPFNIEFSQEDAKLNFYGLPSSNSEIGTFSYLEDCTTVSTGTKESFEISNLTGFESYTVEMQFCNYSYGPQDNNIEYRANVVLFEMASQVLSNSTENNIDTTGPIVAQMNKEVVAQKEYDLAEILTMRDLIDGEITFVGTTEGTYSVKVDGVACDSGKYTFTQEKDYTIEYTIYDTYSKNSTTYNSVTKTITVSATKDVVSPTLTWDETYKDSYYLGTNLTLYTIGVSDNYDANPIVTVKAFVKDGENWTELTVVDNALRLNVAGEYKVEYTATDFSGNVSKLEDTFVVNLIDLGLEDKIEEDYTSEMYYIPTLSLGAELSYYVEKFDVADTEFANGERITTRAIMFAEPCSFVLRYSIFSGNESNIIAIKVVEVVLNGVENESQEPENDENNSQAGNNDNESSSGCSGSIPFTKGGVIVELLAVGVLFSVATLIRRRKNVEV